MAPTRAQRLGMPHVHLRRCDSTNLRARELADRAAPHGTLVSTDEQTAGRGRHERRWWAPAGTSILMTLVLGTDEAELLPLAAGLAVCDIAGPDARLKWPNDVVVERSPSVLAKLAGVLVEARPHAGWLLLGIGVNVAVPDTAVPTDLRGSLASLGRDPAAIDELRDGLVRALEVRLCEAPAATLAAWRQRDVLHNRPITWREGAGAGGERTMHGRAAGVDASGHLVVELSDGARATLHAADVHLM
ncbi:MAG: biotin--[acetyl-CoA-carboxylase] ligase [Solirubrobacteraceae bacterium]